MKRVVIDRAYRLLYRVAYRVMRVYWAVRRPNTHGALVLVWHDERVLLIQNSYTSYLSLPGGYVRSHESGRQAAVRELKEEVGIVTSVDRLLPTLERTHSWEGKTDHVEIFSLVLDAPVTIEVDNREVVSARFFTPAEARGQYVFPPALAAIDVHLAREELGASGEPPAE